MDRYQSQKHDWAKKEFWLQNQVLPVWQLAYQALVIAEVPMFPHRERQDLLRGAGRAVLTPVRTRQNT
jgi:hypothetical protein